jgi:hypothetical protein
MWPVFSLCRSIVMVGTALHGRNQVEQDCGISAKASHWQPKVQQRWFDVCLRIYLYQLDKKPANSWSVWWGLMDGCRLDSR